MTTKTWFMCVSISVLGLGTAWLGCGGKEGAGPEGPFGFIGGPCESDADCKYDRGVCLSDGVEQGLCSRDCGRFCPDQEGFPVTFCVDVGGLPGDAGGLAEGACVSKCNTGFFPGSGCRRDHGCVVVERYNEPDVQAYVCLPGRESELATCLLDLADRGVAFEPTLLDDESPETNPDLTCHVEHPVYVFSPIGGVDLRFPDGSTALALGSCEMAHALADTLDDLRAHGVASVEIGQTYSCRVIAGTDELSRHGFGDAVDIYAFELEDGTRYSLVDDWEHDTESPQSAGAVFLYETAQRWFEAEIWNIILTPNYNEDHDDHFHVDLTPDTHVLL